MMKTTRSEKMKKQNEVEKMEYDYYVGKRNAVIHVWNGKLKDIIKEIEAKENISLGKIKKFKRRGLVNTFIVEIC